MNKKGYFFIIDAFIGSAIIFLALFIILNSGVSPTKINYNYEMAEDYGGFMLNTRMEDINSQYVRELVLNNITKNTKLTIMEQVNEFVNKSNIPNATNLVKNVSEPLIPDQYSFSYVIKGSPDILIYNRTKINLSNAKLIIASKKITFLQMNATTIFGPKIVEIKVWI